MKILNLSICILTINSLIYIVNSSINRTIRSLDTELRPNCVSIKNLFINEGLIANNEKISSNSGNLKICRKERSCCTTRGIESKLNIRSKTEFQQKFKNLINNSIETSLLNWAKQFNNYYIDVIQLGYKEFDLMFEKLYGLKYKENYELFNDLFKNIQLYHEKGDLNLEQYLDDFFEKLFVRLFKMLNPNYEFHSEYQNCIIESFSLVEPFGDIPKNLLSNLKRQLGASRTFVLGLEAGANIIRQLNQIDISNSCGNELMRINYCSVCSGYLNLNPCKLNCEFTYSKCMVNYKEFEGEWNKYLNTIIHFGRRLENTLNLENTLSSMNYKISDVIMYFQENRISITDKVFERCNHKKLNKRSIQEDDEDSVNAGKFKETLSKNQEIAKTWKRLATEVKKKIKSLKSYWSKMPKAICKNSNRLNQCWNGTELIDLDKQIKPNFNLIRIQKDTNIYRLIEIQKNRLQIINSKLVSSYNGNGLENFDFETQASNSFAVSTELNDYEDEDLDDEDVDYDKINKIDQKTETDYEYRKTEENSVPDLNKDDQDDFNINESNVENIEKHDSNKLENSLNTIYAEKPRDANLRASLNSSSHLIKLSIYSLIISQFIYQFIYQFLIN